MGKPTGGEDKKLIYNAQTGDFLREERYEDKPFLVRLHSGEAFGDWGLVLGMGWGLALGGPEAQILAISNRSIEKAQAVASQLDAVAAYSEALRIATAAWATRVSSRARSAGSKANGCRPQIESTARRDPSSTIGSA